MLTVEEQQELFNGMKEVDQDDMEFKVEVEEVQPGRTFSAEAMDQMVQLVALWIGARTMAQWEKLDVPPTTLSVTVEVHAR